MDFKKILVLVIFTWTILISTSFLWNYHNALEERERIAFQTAKSFFDLIVMTREWNALHGGVYVPVTEKTQPNPYLETPMRDIDISDSLKLTKVNPAFMTRQISEIAGKQGISFHITSLNPIRPANRPTATESGVLKEFEKGIKEKGWFIEQEGDVHFFYMAPLKTQKVCLKCHGAQGYKLGDIRGGISVILPFAEGISLLSLMLGHAGIGLAGLSGIVFAGMTLRRAYNIIKKQAAFDSLTGIANRRNFSESILKEFRRHHRYGGPLSIIMCDIDNFKAYNDNYGHDRGDMCLKRVAQTIQATLRRPTDFCARYGGEEFAVVLPDTSLGGAVYLAEKIRKNIEDMHIEHKKTLSTGVVTASFGVTSSEKPALDSHEALIKQADMALFEAKKRGKNRVASFSQTAQS